MCWDVQTQVHTVLLSAGLVRRWLLALGTSVLLGVLDAQKALWDAFRHKHSECSTVGYCHRKEDIQPPGEKGSSVQSSGSTALLLGLRFFQTKLFFNSKHWFLSKKKKKKIDAGEWTHPHHFHMKNATIKRNSVDSYAVDILDATS